MVAAADDPPLTTIEPHLEMSYNRVMPGEVVFTPSAGTMTAAGKILFYCNSAPGCGGGQTPICDMRKVYRDIVAQGAVLGPLLDRGVRYSRFLPAASKSLYNWEKTFYTEDKAEVKLYSYLLISSKYPVIISDFLGGASAGWAGLQRGVEGGGPAALLVHDAEYQVHPATLPCTAGTPCPASGDTRARGRWCGVTRRV